MSDIRVNAPGPRSTVGDTSLATIAKLGTIVLVVAVLHYGKEVFLPLALAVLVAFALSPLVSFLRRRGIRQVYASVAAVVAAGAVASVFVFVLAGQLAQLADDLPKYQTNILSKLDDIQDTGSDNRIMARLSAMLDAVSAKLEEQAPAEGGAGADEKPVKVEVVEVTGPGEVFRTMILPVLAPLAAAGLAAVVVLFLLIEREDLRDRFIRLVGWNDINRTTRMIEEAARRVSRYLLVQLLVNVIYAVPIGVGLWLLGVPNAIFFGLVTLVLRFIPYIGSFISAGLPLLMAFAVSPDWYLVIWTAALFLVVEFVTSNFIEPHLYGSRTGLSPLAVIISAVFWTWIWGPMGLIIATPLTVCLVVLGRYIPQFEFFSTMFGDEPALAPHSRLYQRLLSGDIHECTARAEETIEEVYLAEYYRDVAIPALRMAQHDYDRGTLSASQEERVVETGLGMVRELAPLVEEELLLAKQEAEDKDDDSDDGPKGILNNGVLDGEGHSVIVIGGRSRLDDVAAALVGQAMEAEGANVEVLPRSALAAGEVATLAGAEGHTVVLNFLDASHARALALQVRRVKRAAPDKRVGLLLWAPIDIQSENGDGPGAATISQGTLQQALDQGADFAVTSLEEALSAAFADDAPKPLPQVRKSRPPRQPRIPALQGAA